MAMIKITHYSTPRLSSGPYLDQPLTQLFGQDRYLE